MKKNEGHKTINEGRREFVRKLKYSAPVITLLALEAHADRPGGSSIRGPEKWNPRNPNHSS